MSRSPEFDRRDVVRTLGASAVAAALGPSRAIAQALAAGPKVSVEQFGARRNSGQDDTRAIQAAIDAIQRRGGGTIIIPGRYRCGNIVISGRNVRIEGQGGQLVDARLTISSEALQIQVADLELLDTRGDPRTFLLDISGRDCTFSNVHLTKDPIAGGYQMYIRQIAARCRFNGLRLRGSNGVMVAGSGHTFENFDFQSTMSKGMGGDDAFAIKALEAATENIAIRNGVVRGYAAIVSFGSEVGSRRGAGPAGAVRRVTVERVVGDRCGAVALFKPGALGSDWENGIIDGVVLADLKLSDQAGDKFRSGIRMIAARGAIIRNVQARGIEIVARARDRHVAPTAAVDLTLLDIGAPATIENVNLQVRFVDPYAGAPHGGAAPGYPVDQIVRVEKRNPQSGRMSGIVLDIEGRGASFAGIYVGPGLDDAVSITRAVLTDVATDPPAVRGAGGIWSNSRLKFGNTRVESVKGPRFGGPALSKSSHD